MIRVAIETSTTHGSVAIGRDGRLLTERVLGAQRRHAENLLPALAAALAGAGVERNAIGAVVVGAGPGSFTGVRVAGATAKGLAASLDVPLLAYPSLLALAAAPAAGPGEEGEGAGSESGDAAGGTRPVCALLDARRGEVYAGCWWVGASSIETLLEPSVGPVEEVLDAVRGEAAVFLGEGAQRYRDAVERAGGRVVESPAYPSASTLLWLAEHHGERGAVPSAAEWEPLYIRASGAERGVAG